MQDNETPEEGGAITPLPWTSSSGPCLRLYCAETNHHRHVLFLLMCPPPPHPPPASSTARLLLAGRICFGAGGCSLTLNGVGGFATNWPSPSVLFCFNAYYFQPAPPPAAPKRSCGCPSQHADIPGNPTMPPPVRHRSDAVSAPPVALLVSATAELAARPAPRPLTRAHAERYHRAVRHWRRRAWTEAATPEEKASRLEAGMRRRGRRRPRRLRRWWSHIGRGNGRHRIRRKRPTTRSVPQRRRCARALRRRLRASG